MMPQAVKINEKLLALLLYSKPETPEPIIIPNSININKVPTALPFKPGNAISTAQAKMEGESNPKAAPNKTEEHKYKVISLAKARVSILKNNSRQPITAIFLTTIFITPSASHESNK
jgi:hypothetical protein